MIGKLNHYSLQNNPTIFDEEAFTALELAARTAGKFNEVIDAQNTLKSETEKHLAEQDARFDTFQNVTIRDEIVELIKYGEFDEAINKYLGYLNERIDNLVNNTTEGSTTLDIELLDMRVRLDKQTAGSAGEALRGQIKMLAQRINDNNPYPTITIREVVDGEYYSSTNGRYGTGEEWKRSKYLVPCPEGVMFVGSLSGYRILLTCYDRDLTYLGFVHVCDSATPGEIPGLTLPNTAFVGFTISGEWESDCYTINALKPLDDESVIEFPFDKANENYLYYKGYYVNASGEISAGENWNLLIIPVKSTSRLYTNTRIETLGHTVLSDGSSGYFSANSEFDSVGSVVYFNSNAGYVMININAGQYYYGDSGHLSQYVVLHNDALKKSPLYGKLIFAIGDSITWLDGQFNFGDGAPMVGWQNALRKAGAYVVTKAWSGATLAPHSVYNLDTENVIPSVTDNINNDISLNTFLSAGRPDIIILFAGTNDVGSKSYAEQPVFDNLDGYIVNLASSMFVACGSPYPELFVVNVPYANNTTTRPFSELKTANDSINTLKYSVNQFPIIDVFEKMGLHKFNYSDFMYDAVHPNSKGMNLLGSIIKDSILDHIK